MFLWSYVVVVVVIFQQSFTTLGVALSKVELNESNFSEVLRLFVLARNAGDPHPVRNNMICKCLYSTTFCFIDHTPYCMTFLATPFFCSFEVCILRDT